MTTKLVRTTLRLKENVKKDAERLAIEEDISFQEVFNRALESYVGKKSKISPDFESWADKYIEKNRTALEELAHK